MKRSTVLQIFIHLAVVVLILLIAALPIFSVMIAGSIAEANGCQLDEGSIHPCMVNGEDMGETLYTMGMMGWFMLATIPIGLTVVAVYLILVISFYVIRAIVRWRRAATAG